MFPFTVRDTVLLGRHPWRGVFRAPDAQDAAAIEDALRRTGLLELAERPVPALSSGERQRVAIARCLAQRADVCLLDRQPISISVNVSACWRCSGRKRVYAAVLC